MLNLEIAQRVCIGRHMLIVRITGLHLAYPPGYRSDRPHRNGQEQETAIRRQ